MPINPEVKIKTQKREIIHALLLSSIIFILVILPWFGLATSISVNPQEILSLQHPTEQQTNSADMQQWVQTIQKTPMLSEQNNLQQSSKRRATLMIFVSFSMSDASLMSYLRQSKIVNGQVLLRGFVNNSLRATKARVHSLIEATGGGFSIDPIAFEKLKITTVPTIVLFNQAGVMCLNIQSCIPDPSSYDVIQGNITLDYALSQFAALGEAAPKTAQALLGKLRGFTHA